MKIVFTQKMAGISGSERYFLNILPELHKRGIDAHFLLVQHPRDVQKNKKFVGELVRAGVPVHFLETRLPISPHLIFSIARIIKREGFELLCTNLIHADVWGACVKKFFIRKLALISVKHGYSDRYQTLHGLDHTHIKNDVLAAATRWASNYADKVILISQPLLQFMCKGKLIPQEKVLCIPYGFDFSNVTTTAPSGTLRFGSPQIVVAARVVDVKQHHRLLSILPALCQEFPKLCVTMVGDGPLLEKMKTLTNELGIDSHVRWEGFRDNVHDYIRDSDIMVLPSAAEGFGLVVLEAWHHAKPVVAFDVPAINDIIKNGVGGLLVTPSSSDGLLKTLSSVLKNPDAISSLGESGKIELESCYNSNVMTGQTIDVICSVIDQRQ